MTCEVDFGSMSDDADPVQLYDEKIVVARKAHVCVECGEPIQVGESHRRKSYLWERKFFTEHICDPCHETAAEFDNRLIGGVLWASMIEEWAEGAHVLSCISRLTTHAAKAKMQDQYIRWQAELHTRQKSRKLREAGKATGEPPGS